MDQYQLIRQLYLVEGLSQRAIARQLGISRNTVRRYCNGDNIPWERKKTEHNCPVATVEVLEFIRQCLNEDEHTLDRRQRHTARRIYQRLCQERNYQGGEPTIRRVVNELKEKVPQVFIPLAFDPGEAVQVDWGTATAIINSKKAEINLFCMRLCHSCAPFVVAYPSQREEAFLEGHKTGFEFFNGVTREVIYDNLKTAVKDGWGKTAREQERFRAFRAHYAYEAHFCNPGEGHEKGLVENLVGFARRNFLVPIPRVESYEELNQLLRQRCLDYIKNHQIKGRDLPVRDTFILEQQSVLPLPAKPYETAKIAECKVDYFSTVSFETNHYSAPVKMGGKTVTIKASALEVRIYYRGEEIACHPRCYSKHKTIYQLAHYLPLIEKRPRSVFNARPVRETGIPEEFMVYAKRLPHPDKTMVRLLRLIVEYSVEEVLIAVQKAIKEQQYSIDIIQFYVARKEPSVKLDVTGPIVEAVDLSVYDVLCAGGEIG